MINPHLHYGKTLPRLAACIRGCERVLRYVSPLRGTMPCTLLVMQLDKSSLYTYESRWRQLAEISR